MSIPCKMRPAGLESLPLGYIRAEFLESTGSQGINTGLLAKNITARIKHRPFASAGGHGRPAFFGEKYEDVNGTGYFNNMYASAQTNQAGTGYVARITYRNKASTATFFDLPFGLLTEGEVNLKDLYVKCTVEGKGSKSTTIPSNFRDKDFGYLRLYSYNYSYIGYIYSFSANYDGIPAANYIPALDSTGTPCMFDLVSRKTFRNAGSGQFIAGMTMGQAINLANLPAPTTSDTLTISLPQEATLVLYNQDVNAAIAAAEAKGRSITVRYRDTFDDESILNKYAKCKNKTELLSVNSNAKRDLTSDGEWIYPLPLYQVPGDWPYNYLAYRNNLIRKWNSDLTSTTTIRYMFAYMDEVTHIRCASPKATSAHAVCVENSKLVEFVGDFTNITTMDHAFQRCPALQSLYVTSLAKLTSAAYAFDDCMLNKTLTLYVLEEMPSISDGGSHPITLGVHVDHQSDAEVLAAIENAEAKGWTVTVQWNGTPTAQTASTFGLRKPPVYAKLATSERPDGTVENFLDWGHYATNWEENGYQEFASIEEAYEHFNLEMGTEEEYSN